MDFQTKTASRLAMLGLLLIAAAPASGTIWTVEKDGSGDFTVIQDAVDAASSGDEIRIGPGRFDDFQTIQGGAHWFDIHVLIPDDAEMSLTFTGAGTDQTFIGPDDPGIHQNLTWGISGLGEINLILRALSIENCSSKSVDVYSGSADVRGCRFFFDGQPLENTAALNGGFTNGAVVRDCHFVGLRYGIKTIDSPGGVLVENCVFDCRSGFYAWTSGSRDVQVLNCTFNCLIVGISILTSAGGVIDNCRLTDCAMSIENTDILSITNCEVICNDGDTALYLSNNEPVTIVDNIFQSNGYQVIYLGSYGLGSIHGNHFLQTGDGYAVHCPYHPSFHQDIDLSANWWGTTDTALIDELIYDCNDDPMSYHCVTYEPIAGGPVPVEVKSWSEVKELFR